MYLILTVPGTTVYNFSSEEVTYPIAVNVFNPLKPTCVLFSSVHFC